MEDSAKHNREDASAAEQAAEWLERLKDPQPGDNERFLAWLKDSRANVREALLASSWEVTLQGIDADRKMDVHQLLAEARNVFPLGLAPSQAIPNGEGSRRSRFARPFWEADGVKALAASVAVLTVMLVAFASIVHWGFPNEYATAVGEQRTLELTDGSVVSLNTQSRVRVKLSKETRDLYLTSGQAMFSVAHDAARPFRVHVGSAVVQAIGTKFDVRRIGDRTNVVVIEGKVQITPEAAAEAVQNRLSMLAENTRLAAGQSVSITSSGITAPAPVDVAEVTAWQQRRLKFRFSTLAEVADEFNRFNRTPHIRIEGDQLRARPISGVFEADDPESLISSLASDNTITVDRSEDEFIIRSRPIIVQSGD